MPRKPVFINKILLGKSICSVIRNYSKYCIDRTYGSRLRRYVKMRKDPYKKYSPLDLDYHKLSRILCAHEDNILLPVIRLQPVGKRYRIIDGRHRVTVAIILNLNIIEASVEKN